MSVVSIDDFRGKRIDAKELRNNTVQLKPGLIAPANQEVKSTLVEERETQPIKKLEDIFRISRYLIKQKRYRDNMLFILGINFGLRASDLRQLRFCDLINDNLTFKDNFRVFEIKTRNTRKQKKNRYISINSAVIEAVTLYLEHTPNVCLSDYLFVSQANNRKHFDPDNTEPISIRAMEYIMKGIAEDLDLNFHVSTHTLRKTFCYHQMVMSGNSPRKLLLLQKMLGHSSPAQTLNYIGITLEEIDEAYKHLNLGGSECYIAPVNITESDDNQAV